MGSDLVREAIKREVVLTIRCLCFWGGWLLFVISLRNILLGALS